MITTFEWDELKNKQNQAKHGVSFEEARAVFLDIDRIIFFDEKHSTQEIRYFCIGAVKRGIVTVRFTYRNQHIRIFGAAFWRKGRRIYEKTKK